MATVQHSQFINCPVIDQVTEQSLGRVFEVWINSSNHEVLGFNCRAGFWDLTPRTYPLRQIRMMDDQRIAVEATPDANPTLMLNLKSETSIATGDRIGIGIWTQRGQWLGDVTDYSFDPGSGAIIDYLCIEKSLSGSIQRQFSIAAEAVVDAGLGWLLVSEPVVQPAAATVLMSVLPLYAN